MPPTDPSRPERLTCCSPALGRGAGSAGPKSCTQPVSTVTRLDPSAWPHSSYITFLFYRPFFARTGRGAHRKKIQFLPVFAKLASCYYRHPNAQSSVAPYSPSVLLSADRCLRSSQACSLSELSPVRPSACLCLLTDPACSLL